MAWHEHRHFNPREYCLFWPSYNRGLTRTWPKVLLRGGFQPCSFFFRNLWHHSSISFPFPRPFIQSVFSLIKPPLQHPMILGTLIWFALLFRNHLFEPNWELPLDELFCKVACLVAITFVMLHLSKLELLSCMEPFLILLKNKIILHQ